MLRGLLAPGHSRRAALAQSSAPPTRPPEPLAATSCWEPVDLLPILTGEHVDEEAEILRRADGVALLYRGRLHAAYGEPESCKGWLALAAVAERIDAAEPVVYLDYEDTAANIVARLARARRRPGRDPGAALLPAD